MPAGKPPITRHPLFPAVVALWFGALFGIGSLAIRPSLLESTIVSLNIDTVFAAAAPPLGATARILIALAMAGLGGLLGAMLARRIGKPKPVARQRMRGAVPVERMVDTAAQPTRSDRPEPVQTGRRSQLISRHDTSLGSDHFDRAPLPGNTPILDVSQFGLEGFDPETENRSESEAEASPASGSATDDLAQKSSPDLDSASVAPDARPTSTSDDAATPLDSAPDSAELSRLPGGSAPAGESVYNRTSAPGLFAQPFNAKVSEIRWQDGPAATDAPHTADAQPDAGIPKGKSLFQDASEAANDTSLAERIVSSDLGDLSPLELLERLAISLRRKRDREAAAGHAAYAEAAPDRHDPGDDAEAPAEIPQEMADTFQPDEAEEETEAADAPFSPPVRAIPAALQPVGLEVDDEDDDLNSFAPPRHIGQGMASSATPPKPASLTAEGSSADAAASDLDAGYSSLLNLSRSTQSDPRFVRIEEPESASEVEPVVVFPGQEAQGAGPFSRPAQKPEPQPTAAATAQSNDEAHDQGSQASGQSAPFASPAPQSNPEETERALRSALANIQRMSGAA